MVQLRPYQQKGIEMLYDAIREGNKRIAWVYPTGAGKSTVCSRFVKSCTRNEKRVLFFVHSKELVQQFADRLRNQFGIVSGIIMAGTQPRRDRLVQVASVQTLVRRKMPDADVVIIDEAHHAKASTYKKVLANYPDKIIIGLTATPFRADGKGLKDVFEKIVHPIKIRQLIDMGHLVGTKVFAPEESANMNGVNIVAGDFDKKEMAERFSDVAVVRGVVENYKKHALGKKAIVFSVNIELSKEVCENFNNAGIRAAHLDGSTKKIERAKVIRQFSQGIVQVLCNVNLFLEGFDVPDTEVVIMNRATKSLGLYVQCIGRGLRPALDKEHKLLIDENGKPVKPSCIVLDHGENTFRHGFVEDYDMLPFTLEGVKKSKKKNKDEEKKTKPCPSCRAVNDFYARQCACGFEFPVKKKTIRFGESTEFVALDRDAMILERLLRLPYKQAIGKIPLGHLRLFAILRDYKRGWWFHTAIDHYGIDVMKDHPNAFREVNFLLEVAEEEAGVSKLYEGLKQVAIGKPDEVVKMENRVEFFNQIRKTA